MATVNDKANCVLVYAKELSRVVRSWADFSAAMFDQSTGYVARVFPDDTERQQFFETPQHEAVNGILVGLMNKFGVVAGSEPTKRTGEVAADVPSD